MPPLAFFPALSGFLEATHSASPSLASLHMLLAILVPAVCALVIAFGGSKLPLGATKLVAWIGFAVPAWCALWVAATYVSVAEAGEYQFLWQADLGLAQSLGIQLMLGINGISAPMYVLAGIVGLAAGAYAIGSKVERQPLYLLLLLVMQSGLMGIFSSVDLFFYYFFHEFALIPTFILIAMWGRTLSSRKVVAMELTIYLTLGAMITLGGLVALYVTSGATAFNLIALQEALATGTAPTQIFLLLLIGFGILVSLFPFHTWAPPAYSTAPAPAAMLHAGVLKKFGLYGLIQIAVPLLPSGLAGYGELLMWLALGNVLIIGLVTIAQDDLKRMLGNASVMHMGYAFLGIYAFSVMGAGGAVLMMFAHGLSVALLFLLADAVERRGQTGDMRELGGMAQTAPVLCGLFIAATMASIGLPGFANFWGELVIFTALWQSPHPWVAVAAIAGIVISAIYALRAVARIFFGEPKAALAGTGDLEGWEKWPALLLLAVLLAVGIWPRGFSDQLDAALAKQYPVNDAPVATATVTDHAH
ncbi:MAG: NADH-quinone oxidoreductase subunit M [Verrucomicrobiota bacterium JB022]|nr:NADH-quinone oxidoreductase subunit M [Verrucomicrobiota bacterium JB022]